MRHGVLSSTPIDLLFPGDSPQQLRRRLKLLYNLGALERPLSQRVVANMGAHYSYTPEPRIGRFVLGARPRCGARGTRG